MKSLKQYINEDFNKYTLKNVKITYDIVPNEFYVQAPENYQESNIQQYLDDALLNNLPTGPDNIENFLGENVDNLNDVYFEYKTFEHLSNSTHTVDLRWDARFSQNDNDEHAKLNVFKITDLQYKLNFDEFTILNDNSSKAEDILNKIFSAFDSNDENKYPVTIQYDKDKLEFDR